MARANALRRLALATVTATIMFGGFAVVPVQALGLLLTVDTTTDAVDTNTGDLVCNIGGGACSLRAAIMQANAIDPGGSPHRIVLPAGTYTLTVGAREEDNALGGDLDIKQHMDIVGAGSGQTIIQGSAVSAALGLDRIFDLRADGISVTISGVTLRRGNPGNRDGSAIAVRGVGQNLRLESSVVRDNLTTADAPIEATNSNLTIVDSLITANVSDGPTIDHRGGDLTIRRTTISGNEGSSGTVRFDGGGEGFIDRTTISGNTNTSADGLAIQLGRSAVDTSTMLLRNSTIVGNGGFAAAAIGVRESNTMTIESSTIAGNGGWGIWPSATTTVRNTLFAGNDLGNCDAPLPVSLGNNLDTGSTCGFDQSGDIENGKAKLGALASNGGPTKTRALGSGSDAIDAGKSCPAIDQRGVSRPKDGDSDGTKTCDIGAYEAAKGTTPAPSVEPTAPPSPTPEVTPEATAEATPEATPDASAEATPGASAAPGESAVAGQTPAPSLADVPSGSEGGADATLWIVLGVIGLILVLALGFALGRSRRAPPTAPGSPPPSPGSPAA